MSPAVEDTRAAVAAIREGWARHRAAASQATADRLLGPVPAVMGLDDLDSDMAELLAARDRRSQP